MPRCSLARPLLVATFALSFELSLTEVAVAETSDPPSGYKIAVTEAVNHSAEENWEEARLAFERAHVLYPNARTLRGLGIVSYQMNDYRRAYRHLLAALLEKRRALTEDQDEEVRALLKKTEDVLARYTTRHLPRGAKYFVNDQPIELETNGALLVTLGSHALRVATESGELPAQLEVHGGEVGPLPVEMPPPQEPPQEEEEVESPVVTTQPVPEPLPLQAESRQSPWPIVTMAAGGVMVVTGAVLFAIGRNDVSQVENAAEGTEWHTLADRHDRAPVFTGVGAGLMGVGAALGITGLTL